MLTKEQDDVKKATAGHRLLNFLASGTWGHRVHFLLRSAGKKKAATRAKRQSYASVAWAPCGLA